MSARIAMKCLIGACCAILGGCGGWKLGAGNWGPLGVDGMYVCYAEKPLDPKNCSPAAAYICSGNNTEKRIQVKSYFSFGDPEELVKTYSVPALAKAVHGSGPFVGFSDYKRLSGVCAARQYILTAVP